MVDRIGHLRRRQMVGSLLLESRHPHLGSLEIRHLGSPLQGSRHRLEIRHPGSPLQGSRRLEIRPGNLQLLAVVGHLKNNSDYKSSRSYPSLHTSRCNVCKTPTRGEWSFIFPRADESYLELVLSVH